MNLDDLLLFGFEWLMAITAFELFAMSIYILAKHHDILRARDSRSVGALFGF